MSDVGAGRPQPTLQWLGTAGFRITVGGRVILIDPFLTRNDRAVPRQPLGPSDMADADYVFVSHGHHDHLGDVPAVVEASGAAVFCSGVAAQTLKRRGVPDDKLCRLSGGEELRFEGFGVRVAACEHSKADLKLMISAAPRMLKSLPGMFVEGLTMPGGPLLVFRLDLGGLTVTHMGSLCRPPAGSDARALVLERPDALLVPLRGRSDIAYLAADLVLELRPRAVIPQHHDNFMPPLSPPVDVASFRSLVAEKAPDCICYEAVMNVEFGARELFGNSRTR